MNRDFFEKLTDPKATGECRPLTPEETALAAELRPALALLRDAAPENGVNLAPRWEAFLASEMQSVPPASPRASTGNSLPSRAPRVWSHWMSYAAVLLIGIGLGLVGSQPIASLASGKQNGRLTETSHYTPSERQLMMALLEADTEPGRELTSKAQHELARCVACHDALNARLQQPGFSADPFSQIPAMSDWGSLLAQRTLNLVQFHNGMRVDADGWGLSAAVHAVTLEI